MGRVGAKNRGVCLASAEGLGFRVSGLGFRVQRSRA